MVQTVLLKTSHSTAKFSCLRCIYCSEEGWVWRRWRKAFDYFRLYISDKTSRGTNLQQNSHSWSAFDSTRSWSAEPERWNISKALSMDRSVRKLPILMLEPWPRISISLAIANLLQTKGLVVTVVKTKGLVVTVVKTKGLVVVTYSLHSKV